MGPLCVRRIPPPGNPHPSRARLAPLPPRPRTELPSGCTAGMTGKQDAAGEKRRRKMDRGGGEEGSQEGPDSRWRWRARGMD